LADKQQVRFVSVDRLELEGHATLEVYLEGVDFALLLIKEVFVNEDGSVGVLYLVSSDTSLPYDQRVALYQKRWNVTLSQAECFLAKRSYSPSHPSD